METMSQLSGDELVLDKVKLAHSSSVLSLISRLAEYDEEIFGSLMSGRHPRGKSVVWQVQRGEGDNASRLWSRRMGLRELQKDIFLQPRKTFSGFRNGKNLQGKICEEGKAGLFLLLNIYLLSGVYGGQ